MIISATRIERPRKARRCARCGRVIPSLRQIKVWGHLRPWDPPQASYLCDPGCSSPRVEAAIRRSEQRRKMKRQAAALAAKS